MANPEKKDVIEPVVLSMEQFDPTREELTKIAEQARAVVVTDVNDKAQLALVDETRKALKKARVAITNKGSELRAGAIKFQKDVIERERELVAIIEPEEKRLLEIEKEIERKQEIERMQLLLPVRRARIAAIGYTVEISDEELNGKSIEQFESFFTSLQQIVNEAAAKKLADAQAKVDAEAKRQADETAAREREEKARADERAKIAAEAAAAEAKREADAKAERDRLAAEAKAAADKVVADAAAAAKVISDKAGADAKVAKEKADAEERARQAEIARKEKEAADAAQEVIRVAAEKAAIEKAARYTKFLTDNGVTKENATQHEQRHVGNTVQLWRKVATYVTE